MPGPLPKAKRRSEAHAMLAKDEPPMRNNASSTRATPSLPSFPPAPTSVLGKWSRRRGDQASHAPTKRLTLLLRKKGHAGTHNFGRCLWRRFGKGQRGSATEASLALTATGRRSIGGRQGCKFGLGRHGRSTPLDAPARQPEPHKTRKGGTSAGAREGKEKGWRRWTGRTERGPRKDTARGRQRKTKQKTESN